MGWSPVINKNDPFLLQHFLCFWLRCFGAITERWCGLSRFSTKKQASFLCLVDFFFFLFVVTMIPGSKSRTVEKACLCLFGTKPHLWGTRVQRSWGCGLCSGKFLLNLFCRCQTACSASDSCLVFEWLKSKETRHTGSLTVLFIYLFIWQTGSLSSSYHLAAAAWHHLLATIVWPHRSEVASHVLCCNLANPCCVSHSGRNGTLELMPRVFSEIAVEKASGAFPSSPPPHSDGR